MERGFLSQKWSGRGRGVKEKDLNGNKKNTSSGIGVSTDSEDTMNDDSPIGVAFAVREGVTPSVVDMTVKMGKQNSLDDITVPGSFPPLSTPVSTTASNVPGKSLYANIIGKPSGKKVNVHTLFTPGGNGIDVVVPVDSIQAISERFANTAYGFFLGKKMAIPVVLLVRNTGLKRSCFAQYAMLENGPWFIRNNLLILKKWHPDENLLKEDVSIVPVWVKLHGVPVTAFSEDGLSAIATKLGTPLMLDSYTSDMCMQSLCGNKKKGVEPTIEISNSNTFDVLISVDNDGEFGKLRLLDNDGNPLVLTGIMESDSEVELRDSYPDNDDYDPYDDDMYENHDLSKHLQSICDDLDITVHGKKKK
ncbi:zinc finger, CCHC-type containing protein [Tanacetum coccineum]